MLSKTIIKNKFTFLNWKNYSFSRFWSRSRLGWILTASIRLLFNRSSVVKKGTSCGISVRPRPLKKARMPVSIKHYSLLFLPTIHNSLMTEASWWAIVVDYAFVCMLCNKNFGPFTSKFAWLKASQSLFCHAFWCFTFGSTSFNRSLR